ncbi:xylulokinase [Pelagibius sp.]|uniref:xylulokinase n=1 Tax=Pelagibius sp. TaxID=1931238 RepID=UPI003B50568D
MARDLYLAIDVGTGGIRSALVDRQGRILAFSHQEHEQIVPHYGWSEQRPADWWDGVTATLRAVVGEVEGAADRITAICACGQMHGSVLIDAEGRLTRDTALLWNDKRTAPQVDAFTDAHALERYLTVTANLATPAWPAFKLRWIAENDPQAYDKAATVLMPKDYIGYRLTGERAWDTTEASMSFLMDASSGDWSKSLLEMTGLRRDLLPEIKATHAVLGPLSEAAARETGLTAGVPVLVGGGDYPVALLGSGVAEPGMASDVTGTSTIVSVLHRAPVIDPQVSNVATVEGHWASFALLDAGGDAVRWARRAFHENALSYDAVTAAAERADCGASSLFFLPYLSGERFGAAANARAQFFGLTAGHGLPDLHRAVLEGVAFAVRRKLDMLQGGGKRPERFVAAGGGAKSALWVAIKASMLGTPYLVPEELECGIVGAACMMAVASGDAPDLKTAVARMVRFEKEVVPDPAWSERYDRMAPVFDQIFDASVGLYGCLDALDGDIEQLVEDRQSRDC